MKDELKDIFTEMGVDYEGKNVIHLDHMVESQIEHTKIGLTQVFLNKSLDSYKINSCG